MVFGNPGRAGDLEIALSNFDSMPGIPQRVSRLVRTSHFLHQSAVLRGPTVSPSVAEENKDVASMDRLLKVVRESRIAAFRVYNEHISSLYRREIQPSLPQVSGGQLPHPLVVQRPCKQCHANEDTNLVVGGTSQANSAGKYAVG